MAIRSPLSTLVGVVALITGLTGGCSAVHHQPTAACDDGSAASAVSTAPSASATSTEPLATNPEITTGYRRDMIAVHTATFAVSTANPLSTQAACRVLADGGTAADALVTAQTVLGLAEPQASGIGGGAFMMYYDAGTHSVQSYDGREIAPRSASENYLRWIDDRSDDSTIDHRQPQPSPRASGRSVGVPGVLRLLELAHHDHGHIPWSRLFDPAIGLADHGLHIGHRLAQQIAASASDLSHDPAARAYFLLPDGSGKPEGSLLANPAMAKTLGAIATDGPNAFYHGEIARDIVDAVSDTTAGRTPGRVTLEDLAHYRARRRNPVCTPYRGEQICGMPPPSSGGMTVAATLDMLSHFDLEKLAPTQMDRNGGRPMAPAVHLISEAERLAYADRDTYLADPDFVPLPGNTPETLLDPNYLRARAALINPRRSMGTAAAGAFPRPAGGAAEHTPEHGTTQVSVVDRYGNAAAMTTTIESAFGSFHMVDGFLLNNQLTDFSAVPIGSNGAPVANRVQPGKRPRSSMSPTLVFDRREDTPGCDRSSACARGRLHYVTGSPGGTMIIQFVVKVLVSMIDWHLDPQQAVGAVDFGAENDPITAVDGEHPDIDTTDNGAHDPLVQQLRAMGHQVSVAPQSSGASALRHDEDGWTGGADPRREGTVLGDPPHR